MKRKTPTELPAITNMLFLDTSLVESKIANSKNYNKYIKVLYSTTNI